MPWWYAEYPVGTSKGVRKVIVEGVTTSECPVSLISPESIVMISTINRSRHVKEAVGTSSLGDISRLPARFVDAIEIVEIERIRIENAKAEEQERSLSAV